MSQQSKRKQARHLKKKRAQLKRRLAFMSKTPSDSIGSLAAKGAIQFELEAVQRKLSVL